MLTYILAGWWDFVEAHMVVSWKWGYPEIIHPKRDFLVYSINHPFWSAPQFRKPPCANHVSEIDSGMIDLAISKPCLAKVFLRRGTHQETTELRGPLSKNNPSTRILFHALWLWIYNDIYIYYTYIINHISHGLCVVYCALCIGSIGYAGQAFHFSGASPHHGWRAHGGGPEGQVSWWPTGV